MAMTVMMVPISQGVAAMANGLPNKSFPGMSLIVTSTRSIFRFEEDKKDIQSSTSHSFFDTHRAIFHQKCYDYTHPLSRNMPRTKSKTRYSEWESYNLNALYSILKSSRLIFSKWKRLKVRVDGWVVAEFPVVNGDEWDDHQQSQSDNLG